MKNILICIIIISFSTSSFAQGLRGGVKVGTNATFLIDNNSTLNNFRKRFKQGNGYQIGIEASYMVFGIVGILAETNYQNNEFSFVQEKIVDILPNGNMSNDAIVNEHIKVENGSFRFGVSLLLDFGRFGMSLGSNLGFLTSSKADVIRSYAKDSFAIVNNIEELQYDFINDVPGEDGAYWEQSSDPTVLFDRLNIAANLAFQIDILPRLGLEVKTNYGFGDIVSDIYASRTGTFGRQLDLLLSVKYTFPIKIKLKKESDTPEDEDM